MMRFLADENVSRLVVARLRAAGLDVTAIGETSSGALDNDVLGELVVRQRLGVHGIVLLELDRLSNVREADLVATVISMNADKLPGNLLVIEPGRVRVRPLSR